MKKTQRFFYGSLLIVGMALISSCSDDDKHDDFKDVTIGFNDVPAQLIAGPTSYGENLYYGASEQITTGYFAQLNSDTYVQFPVNYAEQTWEAGQPWQYTFFNGGVAVSNWHELTGNTYDNQMSVFNTTSPSGNNFIVTFGKSYITDPSQATLADYSECGHIYITDSKGYGVSSEGAKNPVSGVSKYAKLNSVMVANTTYPYLTMKNGNAYASKLDETNEGWFKVQFIAFDSNSAAARPIGYVEAYLANFDKSLEGKAGFCGSIRDDWFEVNLSSFPEASILVINFVGSDSGEYGLNTPAYCALDNFKFTVENN